MQKDLYGPGHGGNGFADRVRFGFAQSICKFGGGLLTSFCLDQTPVLLHGPRHIYSFFFALSLVQFCPAEAVYRRLEESAALRWGVYLGLALYKFRKLQFVMETTQGYPSAPMTGPGWASAAAWAAASWAAAGFAGFASLGRWTAAGHPAAAARLFGWSALVGLFAVEGNTALRSLEPYFSGGHGFALLQTFLDRPLARQRDGFVHFCRRLFVLAWPTLASVAAMQSLAGAGLPGAGKLVALGIMVWRCARGEVHALLSARRREAAEKKKAA
jgi:hypothetical protein